MFAREKMDQDSSLLVFPEGQRTKYGALNPFMSGTGLLIQKLGAPAVPMRIDGLCELKRANRHFAWPGCDHRQASHLLSPTGSGSSGHQSGRTRKSAMIALSG